MTQVVWIVASILVYLAIRQSMIYCRQRHIENPILTFRLWLAERKDRA